MLITEADGMRIVCSATNGVDIPIAGAELRHRRRACTEDRIWAARDTGLRNLPLADAAQNRICSEIVQLALDLPAWMSMLALDGAVRGRESKRLRLRLFPAVAQPVTTGSCRRLARHWPWTQVVTTASERLQALSKPG